jgi:hypothetical protein
MRCVGYVAHIREMRNFEGVSVNDTVTSKWILQTQDARASGSGEGQVAGSSSHGCEPLGSVKYWKFLD